MTTEHILYGFLLSCVPGLLALGAQLLWLSQYQLHPYWFYTLCGYWAVLCMLGLRILGNLLACWPTTSC